jgi:hypothetical protein
MRIWRIYIFSLIRTEQPYSYSTPQAPSWANSWWHPVKTNMTSGQASFLVFFLNGGIRTKVETCSYYETDD